MRTSQQHLKKLSRPKRQQGLLVTDTLSGQPVSVSSTPVKTSQEEDAMTLTDESVDIEESEERSEEDPTVMLDEKIDEWLLSEAPTLFLKVAAEWLEEFGNPLLCAQIEKRVKQDKKEKRSSQPPKKKQKS